MAPVTAVMILIFIGGLLINLYIAVGVIIQWLDRKPVIPLDQVLISIGISRMFLQVFSLLDVLLTLYQEDYQNLDNMTPFAMDSLLIFFNYFGIWLSTLFAVVFLLKIAPFSYGLFLRLKGIISRRMVLLIVFSLVVSIGYTLMYMFIVTSEFAARNVTSLFDGSMIRGNFIMLFLVGNIIPIGIYVSSTALLIYSLCHQMNKMRANNISTRFSLDAYYMAINSLAFCFLCYVCTIISDILLLHYIFVLHVIWIQFIRNVFPIIHSVFLIYKTYYLRYYFTELYHGVVHCVLCRGQAKSEDTVVTVT